MEAQRHTVTRHQQNIVLIRNGERRNNLIALTQVNRNQAGSTVRIVIAQTALLHHTAASSKHQVLSILIALQLHDLSNMLTALELQQVRNVLALRVTTGFLQLVTLRTVHATQVREEQNPAVRSGHEEVLHHVITAQRGTLNALTATVLATVLITAGALNVAAASNRHHDLLLGDEVFHGHVAVVAVHNLSATLIAVAVHNLAQLLRDNLALASLRSNNRVVLSDHAHQLIVTILNLLTLQSSQTTQLHV